MIDQEDIVRLCRDAAMFSRRAGFRFKATPVLVWEFAVIDEFMAARRQVLQAIEKTMTFANPGEYQRIVGSDTVEFDCYSVTFRLVCKQRLVTRDGSYGAAEIN